MSQATNASNIDSLEVHGVPSEDRGPIIIWIDHDKSNLENIKDLLTDIGYLVRSFQEVSNRDEDSIKLGDLVVINAEITTDNAFRVCKWLKTNTTVPVMMISKRPDAEESFGKHRKLKHRADYYVTNPDSLVDLIDDIDAIVPIPALSLPRIDSKQLIASLERQNTELEEGYARLKEEHEKIQTQLQRVQDAATKTTNESSKDQEKKALKALRSFYKKKIDDLQSLLSQKNDKSTDIAKENANLSEEVARLKEQLSGDIEQQGILEKRLEDEKKLKEKIRAILLSEEDE